MQQVNTIDTVHKQFGVSQNGKVRQLKTCKVFITVTKHSDLFLLDNTKLHLLVVSVPKKLYLGTILRTQISPKFD